MSKIVISFKDKSAINQAGLCVVQSLANGVKDFGQMLVTNDGKLVKPGEVFHDLKCRRGVVLGGEAPYELGGQGRVFVKFGEDCQVLKASDLDLYWVEQELEMA